MLLCVQKHGCVGFILGILYNEFEFDEVNGKIYGRVGIVLSKGPLIVMRIYLHLHTFNPKITIKEDNFVSLVEPP